MLSEIVVITAKGCPSCEMLKVMNQPDSGLKLLDIGENPRALEIVQKLEISKVPAFVLIKHDDGEICVLDKDFNPVKCVKDSFISRGS